MREGDPLWEKGEEFGDDEVLFPFGILEGKCVVVLHYYLGHPLAPDAEHGSVDYVGQGPLRVIGHGLAKGVLGVPSAEEPALSPHQAHYPPLPKELLLSPMMPLAVRWVGGEVPPLELCNDLFRDLGLG